jgi:hypothetical protein
VLAARIRPSRQSCRATRAAIANYGGMSKVERIDPAPAEHGPVVPNPGLGAAADLEPDLVPEIGEQVPRHQEPEIRPEGQALLG